MDDFYFYACVIALIILIILLAMIGIAISYSKKLLIYPPTYKNCPDYWTEGDGTTGNGQPGYCLFPNEASYRNRGDTDFTDNGNKALPSSSDYADLNELDYLAYTATSNGIPVSISDSNKGNITKYFVKMNGNDASWNTIYDDAYTGLTARCAKRKWAIDNGIVWDGITNYNGCT
jgi:hypothetical protein